MTVTPAFCPSELCPAAQPEPVAWGSPGALFLEALAQRTWLSLSFAFAETQSLTRREPSSAERPSGYTEQDKSCLLAVLPSVAEYVRLVLLLVWFGFAVHATLLISFLPFSL